MLGIRPEAVWLGGDLELEAELGSDLLVHLRTDAPRVAVSHAFDAEEADLESRVTPRCMASRRR